MTFTVTDFPAPLSPTRAVTWPAGTVRSTPRSACTAPKLLRTPSRRRSGSAPVSPPRRAGRSVTPLLVLDAGRVALRLEPRAELGRVDEAVRHHRLGHVLGRHPDGVEEHRGDVGPGLGVGRGPVHETGGRLHAGPEEQGEGSRRLRLEVDGLV